MKLACKGRYFSRDIIDKLSDFIEMRNIDSVEVEGNFTVGYQVFANDEDLSVVEVFLKELSMNRDV